MKKFILLLAFLSFTAACSSDDDGGDSDNCTDIYTPGIILTVQDGGIPVTQNITVTAIDGEYGEELELLEDGKFYGAYERAGTYTVTVTADGYEVYVSEPIEVDEDECHVITEEITVTLQPDTE